MVVAQAYRYSYFADLAIVVLPPETAELAKPELNLFRELRVGLWSFDKTNGTIAKLFTPRNSKPRNSNARAKALESLGRSLQFSKFGKKPKTVCERL